MNKNTAISSHLRVVRSYIMDVRIVAGREGPKDPSKSSLKQQNLGENVGDGGKKESAGMFGRMFGGFSGKEKDGL
jgi:hypothetical protein